MTPCSTPGFPVCRHLPEFARVHVHRICDAIQPSHFFCCPLLLLPSIFPSIKVFSIESAIPIRWPKYWSFSFSISPSNEYSGLIYLRLIGLISLLAKGLSRVFSGTKFGKHQFFMVQLSHLYMTTAKTTALTIRTLLSSQKVPQQDRTCSLSWWWCFVWWRWFLFIISILKKFFDFKRKAWPFSESYCPVATILLLSIFSLTLALSNEFINPE